MILQQTLTIPEATTRLVLDLSEPIPAGTATFRIAWTAVPPKSGKELAAEAEPEEPLPRVSRAQWAEWEEQRKNDPVWQVLDKPVEHDSSWLPEGLTFETFRVKDVRDIIIKDKYGI